MKDALHGARWTMLSMTLVLLFASSVTVVGADAPWLVALGRWIVSHHHVPSFVPFATAHSAGWPNVPALAETLAAFAFDVGGWTALVVAHLAIWSLALAVLAWDTWRAGATDRAVAASVVGVGLAAAPALLVVRLPVLSILPFVALLALLRAQGRHPSRRIWWVVPLTIVWANLHGAVLVGVAVTGLYLLLGRGLERWRESVALGAALAGSVCLTPALWKTPAYFVDVLGGAAATSGVGLWAPIDLRSPFDLVTLAVLVAMSVGAGRHRLPAWEGAAALGLAFMYVNTGRNSVWLALFLAAPAAVGWSRSRSPSANVRSASLLAALMVLPPLMLGSLVASHRGGGVLTVPERTRDAVAAFGESQVVLAPAPLAEIAAVDGARVWMTNPLEAFDADDQEAYLNFQYGRGGFDRALADSDAVVVTTGSRSDRRMSAEAGFRLVGRSARWSFYARERSR